MAKGIDGKILKNEMEARRIIFRYNPQIYANLIDILYEKSLYVKEHNLDQIVYHDIYRLPREYHYNMAIAAIRKTNFYFMHSTIV